MGTEALDSAIRNSAPLLEVVVKWVPGIDYDSATQKLNSVADDFHLDSRPWYGNPQLRVGSATRESLERMFGWEFKRVPLERFDERLKTWTHWQNFFRWDEVSPPTRFPAEVKDAIESIHIEQPGADDNGQWHE